MVRLEHHQHALVGGHDDPVKMDSTSITIFFFKNSYSSTSSSNKTARKRAVFPLLVTRLYARSVHGRKQLRTLICKLSALHCGSRRAVITAPVRGHGSRVLLHVAGARNRDGGAHFCAIHGASGGSGGSAAAGASAADRFMKRQ